MNCNDILYLLHRYSVVLDQQINHSRLSYSRWQLHENLKAKTINLSVYDTNVFSNRFDINY